MYEWIKNESHSPNATIYSSNITLNRSAINCLQEPMYVMLGIDRARGQVAIYPVGSKDVEDGLVPDDSTYKISIGRSYGRIANRSFCRLLGEVFGLSLSNERGLKFPATFNAAEKMLVINFAGGEIE